jgi:rhodanese-related sulfurtransferase
MSITAAEELAKLGYTNLFNVDGGFLAWQAAGLLLEGE